MAPSRSVEIRVGIFMLVGLAVVAGLIIRFGKLDRFAGSSYNITVIFPNVAGLVREAKVLYAGIPVGKVRAIQFTENAELQVRVTLAIFEGYTIRNDAKFVINQSGLLGDRYIDVVPVGTTAPPLRAGDEVQGVSNVDLTEAIRGMVDILRQAAGTMARIDEAVHRTDLIIQRIDEVLLTTQSLRHVASALANIDATLSNTTEFTAGLHTLVAESRVSLTNTLEQLNAVAGNVNGAAESLNRLVTTHEPDVAVIATNLAASAERLNDLLARLQRGDGTAGKLLVDPTLHDEIVRLVANWRQRGILSKDGPAKRLPGDERRGGKTPVPARPAAP